MLCVCRYSCEIIGRKFAQNISIVHNHEPSLKCHGSATRLVRPAHYWGKYVDSCECVASVYVSDAGACISFCCFVAPRKCIVAEAICVAPFHISVGPRSVQFISLQFLAATYRISMLTRKPPSYFRSFGVRRIFQFSHSPFLATMAASIDAARFNIRMPNCAMCIRGIKLKMKKYCSTKNRTLHHFNLSKLPLRGGEPAKCLFFALFWKYFSFSFSFSCIV